MTATLYPVTAAIEPAAKLSEINPADGITVLRGAEGAACVVTDPSASWGRGVDAAKLTIDRVRSYSGTPLTNVEALSKFVEEAAFEAEASLAREDPDADALFSGAVVTLNDDSLSWASAGDLMIALCSPQNIAWLNGARRTEGREAPTLATRPATWYPGLLGCTRAQRSSNLLALGGPISLSAEHAILILSQSVWSKLDDETIVQEARRSASADRAWHGCLAENLLRIAKSRGAGGHRVVVGIGRSDELSASKEPLSRARGYRALQV